MRGIEGVNPSRQRRGLQIVSTSTVKIDIGRGKTITASITNEAVDDLAFKPGDTASAFTEIGRGFEAQTARRSGSSSALLGCSGIHSWWRTRKEVTRARIPCPC